MLGGKKSKESRKKRSPVFFCAVMSLLQVNRVLVSFATEHALAPIPRYSLGTSREVGNGLLLDWG